MDNRKDIEDWIHLTIQELTDILYSLKNPKFDNQDALDNLTELIEEYPEQLNLLQVEYDLEMQEEDMRKEESKSNKKKKSECHPKTYLRDSL